MPTLIIIIISNFIIWGSKWNGYFISCWRNESAKKEKEERRAAEKAAKRVAWPFGAVAVLDTGSFYCRSMRSAYKYEEWAIQRANNPYVQMPYDCGTTVEKNI